MADNRFTNKRRALDRMSKIPVVARVAARNALDAEGAFLVERIRPNIPVEHGDLADSLEWHRNPRNDKISIVITEGRGQDYDAKSLAIEFGRHDRVAQPHFYPTYRAYKRQIQNRIQKAIRVVVRRVWGPNP